MTENQQHQHQQCAVVLDGKATSERIQQQELAPACGAFLQQHSRRVGLAVVVVGARKDSATYVRMKQRACTAVGIESWKVHIPLPDALEAEDGTGERTQQQQQQAVIQEVLDTIQKLNARDDVDGIIVQLPLPSFCDEGAILATVAPVKDVDGLHPESHAALFQYATKRAARKDANKSLGESGPSFNIPCTPAGCIELLDSYDIPIEGKRVVVLGRSQIVGLPVSLLCLHRNATITICHSRTEDLQARVREADILIAAIGRANFVRGDWIKPGATVIDIGINPVDDTSKKTGYRLLGDVDYDEASKVAHAITPVPGGVGPMTVAMLLRNTVQSAYRRKKTAEA
ncbi:Bifunctional fold protein, partial [Globisporangium splendens]